MKILLSFIVLYIIIFTSCSKKYAGIFEEEQIAIDNARYDFINNFKLNNDTLSSAYFFRGYLDNDSFAYADKRDNYHYTSDVGYGFFCHCTTFGLGSAPPEGSVFFHTFKFYKTAANEDSLRPYLLEAIFSGPQDSDKTKIDSLLRIYLVKGTQLPMNDHTDFKNGSKGFQIDIFIHKPDVKSPNPFIVSNTGESLTTLTANQKNNHLWVKDIESISGQTETAYNITFGFDCDLNWQLNELKVVRRLHEAEMRVKVTLPNVK